VGVFQRAYAGASIKLPPIPQAFRIAFRESAPSEPEPPTAEACQPLPYVPESDLEGAIDPALDTLSKLGEQGFTEK